MQLCATTKLSHLADANDFAQTMPKDQELNTLDLGVVLGDKVQLARKDGDHWTLSDSQWLFC